MKKKKENDKFKTNIFYYYAAEYFDKPTEDGEIRSIDMTEEFWREIETELKKDEQVNIAIIGQVRTGKSTLAIKLGEEIFSMLLRLKKRKGGKFGMKNIARDQLEYSKLMRNEKTNYTVIVTDEDSAMEKIGENVTAEEALHKTFSDVQAVRYVHRISCSPKQVADPNTNVLLEVVSTDKEEGITHCYLYYRMIRAGVEEWQLLGHCNFNVSELVKNWGNIAKYHMKPEEDKTDRDRRLIKKWAKKDYYVEYMLKKQEKLELMLKEGIMKPRQLDYADVVIDVVNNVSGLARLGMLSTRKESDGIIRTQIKKACSKRKIPTSMLGEEMILRDIMGVVTQLNAIYSMKNKMVMLHIKHNKGKIGDAQFHDETKEIAKGIQMAQDSYIDTMQEFHRYSEINKKYNEHLDR